MPLEVVVPNLNLKSPEVAASEVMADANNEMQNVKQQVTSPEAIAKALANGYTASDLATYMSTKADMSLDEANSHVHDVVKSQVLQAKQSGYSTDEIKSFMQTKGYDAQLVDTTVKAASVPTPWKGYDFDPNQSIPENATDLGDLYKNIHAKYSTTGKQIVGIFDSNSAIEARDEINQLNAGLVKSLNKNGIQALLDPETGKVLVDNGSGQLGELDENFFNQVWNSKMEMVGGVAGASLGAMAGAYAGPGWTKAIATPVGAVLGGMAGASAGRGADLTINAWKLQEEISRELYVQQMKEAGIFDGVMGVVGAGAYKTIAYGGKGVMKAYQYVMDGNTKGAFKALKDELHLSDEQAQAITEQFLSSYNGALTKEHQTVLSRIGLTQPTRKELTKEEKSIVAVLSTQQGAEGIVRQAAQEGYRTSNAIIKTLDDRAKSLSANIAKFSDPNTGAIVRNDLNAYVKDVKDFYGAVKQQGEVAVQGTDFAFDLDKLAIEPVLKSIGDRIADPTMKERFINYAARIGTASKDRSFKGLLELRQAVNDFKYSKSGLSVSDIDALNGVITRIDGQVEKGAKGYIPNSTEWLANFKKAKTEYAKMKQFEENVMYQGIMAEGANEQGIRRVINKWSNDKDVDSEVFNAVAEKVSMKTRALMEVAAIDNLSNKYTLGKATDFQAVNFPMLAEEMKGLNLASKEGKALYQAVSDMAKIFKNDPNLSAVSGYLPPAKASNSIAQSVGGKAKALTVGYVWDIVRSRLPGESNRQQALINATSELFKDPLKTKVVDDFMRQIPEPSKDTMRSLVKELQVQAAKSGSGKVDKEWRNMYKQSSSGKLVETDGALGRGIYLFDKVANPTPGAKIVKHEVNLTKMASLEDIQKHVGRPVTMQELGTLGKTTDLYKQLSDKGYQGVLLGDRAMLFSDRTVGAK